jgi:hypothetical protein
VFVDREHQLDWMSAGGAREMNARTPLEARRRGGQTQAAQIDPEARRRGGLSAGRQAAESGRIQMAELAAQRAAEANRADGKRTRARRGMTDGTTIDSWTTLSDVPSRRAGQFKIRSTNCVRRRAYWVQGEASHADRHRSLHNE